MAGSYWFRPAILVIAAIISSQLFLFFDKLVYDYGYRQESIWWIVKYDPGSVRAALTSQAAILLGVFGVLLSLALIPLTIATAQYSNVVIRNFLKDKGTQNVIGFFAFVMFFDVAAALSLPLTVTWDNYPGITSTVSVLFLVGALIATIYFFNHIANLLQATYVTKSVTDELMIEIDSSTSPDVIMEYSDQQLEEFGMLREEISEKGTLVRSTDAGYVAGLNYQFIFNKAERADATVLILKLPGDYVSKNEPIAKYVAKGKIRPRSFARAVDSSYSFGVNRTVMQDISYGVELLTIIAAKALSPAVNDPATAMICIDKIGQVLSRVVSRPSRSPFITGKNGRLRLIADPDDFKSLMAIGFNQIRQYGSHSFEIMVHQLGAIETIAYAAIRNSDRKIIKHHADLILEEGLQNLTFEWSKQQVRDAYKSAVKVIGLRESAPVQAAPATAQS